MSTFAPRQILLFTRLLLSLLLFGVLASAATRLYIQPLNTQKYAGSLRSDLEKELRKAGDVTLSTSDSSADATLSGAGEIWIRGYQSLNPRSGRSVENGIPIYDGYLAVELQNKKGQTFWSYLVTPSASTTNVSRDLARQIAHRVSDALAKGAPAAYTTPLSQPSTILKAAGATFPQPVYAKWFTNYRLLNPNLEIDYDAVGSQQGVRMLLDGQVDFGASDCPNLVGDLAPTRQSDYVFFPTVVGAVVPIVNLPGLDKTISLTPEALAAIYLGTVKKWNDPVIRKSNRGIALPDLEITVVHRADGSGTSFVWTEFLSAVSPAWKSGIGASIAPAWPVGKAARSNEGVAETVKEFGGAIGYVEFTYALQNHIEFAKVQNREGQFVSASLASMARAASTAVFNDQDLRISIINAPGSGAYPIASFTWLVLSKKFAGDSKLEAMKGFLHWMLGPGQLQAAAIGYLALPQAVIAREEAAINQLR